MKLDGRKASHPTVSCQLCGRGAKDLRALDAHGYTYHTGTGKKFWRPPDLVDVVIKQYGSPRPVAPKPHSVAPPASAVAPAPAPVAPTPAPDPHPIRLAKSEWGQAERLAGLPWIVYPSTVDQCDELLDGLAVEIERAHAALPTWLSLRSIITAIRKKLAAQVPA
jgi:hypothetical protein